MTPIDLSLPDDPTLVAWLDGELPPAAQAQVGRAVREHRELALRVQLLRAARAEFAWALERPDAAPPGLPAPRFPWRQAHTLLLAAAAVVVVVVLAQLPQRLRDEAAENPWLTLKLVARQPAWDLFSCVRFELEGTARTDTACRVVQRNAGETDAQLADRLVAAKEASLPLLLEAEVTGPDGIARSGSVARVEGRWTRQASRLAVELVDVMLPHPGISPLLAVAIEPEGVREDFWWGIRRTGPAAVGGNHGFVPEQPGEYRIRFTLRSFVAEGDSRLPKFAEPLSVSTGFAVRGVAGAWSEPVDGMRARIVANTQRTTQPLVFALQLRNESDRARQYNVTGSTMAAIPQPFHFDLLVDGVPWQQRADLGVVTPAMSTGLRHEVGAMRSVIAPADCWRLDGVAPSMLSGPHRFAVRFHFAASVFLATDKELWQGQIDTPAVEIEMPALR